MRALFAAAVLLIVTAAWFGIALLPALREYFGRTDVGPLRVTNEAADIRYFALSFRRYVETQLEALRRAAAARPTVVTTLSDATGVWYAAPGQRAAILFDGEREGTEYLAAISEVGVRVPDDVAVERELYVAGSVEGGAGNVYRAILADGDISLGANATVIRWADAGGSLTVGRGSTLWGRASCRGTMVLEADTHFLRLAAPRIVFGASAAPAEDPRVAVTPAGTFAVSPPSNAVVGSTRWVIDGDFTVPPGGMIAKDMVVSGNLAIGRGAQLGGAVRAREIVAAADCTFCNSVVAAERIALGTRCSIVGPVVVEGAVRLGDHCRVGAPGDETTISALSVHVGHDVVLCGEVWARQEGLVAAGGETRATAAQPPRLAGMLV